MQYVKAANSMISEGNDYNYYVCNIPAECFPLIQQGVFVFFACNAQNTRLISPVIRFFYLSFLVSRKSSTHTHTDKQKTALTLNTHLYIPRLKLSGDVNIVLN